MKSNKAAGLGKTLDPFLRFLHADASPRLAIFISNRTNPPERLTICKKALDVAMERYLFYLPLEYVNDDESFTISFG